MTGAKYTVPTDACVVEKGGMNMCKKDDCDRHEYDYGLCLPHLKEAWLADGTLVIEQAPERETTIDAVEVITNDETTELETRETE